MNHNIKVKMLRKLMLKAFQLNMFLSMIILFTNYFYYIFLTFLTKKI
jgi:hypothetical protein